MTEMFCRTCIYWRATNVLVRDPVGECRRYPPAVSLIPTKSALGDIVPQSVSAWPPVPGKEMCGEWTIRPAALALTVPAPSLDAGEH